MSVTRLVRIVAEPNLTVDGKVVFIDSTTAVGNSVASVIFNGGIAVNSTGPALSSTSGHSGVFLGGVAFSENIIVKTGISLDSVGNLTVSGQSVNRLSIGQTASTFSADGSSTSITVAPASTLFHSVNPVTTMTSASAVFQGGVVIQSSGPLNGTIGSALYVAGGANVGNGLRVDNKIYSTSDLVMGPSTNNSGQNLCSVIQSSTSGSFGSKILMYTHRDSDATLSTLALTIDNNQSISISSSENATGLTNGSFRTLGSIAAGMNAFIGQNLSVLGTASTSILTNGGIIAQGDLVVNRGVIVMGSVGSASLTASVLNMGTSGNSLVSSVSNVVLTTQDSFVVASTTPANTALRVQASSGNVTLNGAYTLVSGVASIAVVNASPGSASSMNLFTASGDDTSVNKLSIYSRGVVSDTTNSEVLNLGWNNSDFVLNTAKSGTGILQSLRIQTGTMGALVLNTSGNVFIGTLGTSVLLPGNINVSGASVLTGLTVSNVNISGTNVFTTSGSLNVGAGMILSNTLRVVTTAGSMTIYGDEIATGNKFSVNSVLTVDTNGNVGIGVGAGTPLVPFHVVGNSILAGSSTVTNLVVTGNLNANSVTLSNSTLASLFVSGTKSNSIQSSGGIVVNGAAVVGQGITIGSNLLVSGTVSAGDSTLGNIAASTVVFSGTSVNSITTLGGISVTKNGVFGGNLSVGGGSASFGNSVILGTTGGFTFGMGGGGSDSVKLASPTSTFFSTQDASGSTSASLVSLGGFASAMSGFFGQNLYIQGTTDTINGSTGTLINQGGFVNKKNARIEGSLIVNGDFTVNGVTVTVNSTVANLADNIITLNTSPVGSKDSGIIFQRFQNENDTGLGDVVADLSDYATFTIPDQTGMGVSEIKFPASANSTDSFYVGYFCKVVSGFSNNQVRKVSAYVGSTRVATLQSVWTSQNPASFDSVNLYNKPFVGIFYNETTDTIDFAASGTSPGSKVLETVFLPVKAASISASIGTTSGTLRINGTENSINTSTGSVVITSGAAIQKDLFLGGDLIVKGTTLTANSGDVLSSQSATGGNNISSPTNVLGLVLGSGVWSADIFLTSRVTASVNYYSSHHIRVVNKGSSWSLSRTYVGDDSIIDFSITTGGQIQYTSFNYTGFVSLGFKYRLYTNE